MNPWDTLEGKRIWKTKAQYFNWLRGGLRKLWSDYPLRKEWKKGQLRPLTQEEKLVKKYHPSTKNVGQCVMCKEWMAGSKLECDHLHPSNGCKDWGDINGFLRYCATALPNELQLCCKPCHAIKTYAERMGITFEQAKIEKQLIAICKDIKKCNKLLASHNLPCNNAKVRKEGVRKLLEERKI